MKPFFDEGTQSLERSIFNRAEVPYKVQQVAVLLPYASKVLPFFFVLNALELSLEGKSISHLIEKESKEEVSPTRTERLKSVIFIVIDTVEEFVAVRQCISVVLGDCTSIVQIWLEICATLASLHEFHVISHVVLKICITIRSAHNVIHTRISELVSVGQLHSNDEVIHLQIVLCLRERLLVDCVILVAICLLTYDRV